MNSSYLSSAIKQYEYYKMLGEKAIAQVSDEALFSKDLLVICV